MRRFVRSLLFAIPLACPLAVLAGDHLFCPACGGSGCAACNPAGNSPAGFHWIDHGDHQDLVPIGGDSFDDARHAPRPGPAPAFVVTGGKWPQSARGEPLTITYSYHNLLDGGLLDVDGNPLTPDFLRASVEEALGLWASVAPLHFVEVEDEGGPVVFGNYPDGQFGQIRFSHRWINGPDPPACFVPGADPATCGAGAKAQAFFPSSANSGGDVFYDNGDRWQEAGTLFNPDILGATVHEVGHSLGLGHTNIPEANMYWVFTRTTGLGTASLHADDIAGIQFIYGAGVGSVTPLVQIPEPVSGVLALLALACWMLGTLRAPGSRTAR